MHDYSVMSDFCIPMDCCPPGSSVQGIFQARIPEWVAISSSKGFSLPWDQIFISCVSCFAGKFFTLWAIRETHSIIHGILNTYDTLEFVYIYLGLEGFARDSVVKNPPVKQEMWVWSLGWENPLEKEMATHSNIVAGRILWTKEPGRLQSMRSQKSDMTYWLNHHQQQRGKDYWLSY